MIVRVVAVDRNPRPGSAHDLLVYQVPDKSREFEVLTQLFDTAKMEWTVVAAAPKARKGATK